MLKNDLISIGLSEKEAVTYLAMLELGETSISNIAAKAKQKRPTTYLIIDSLKEKGMVSMVKRNKKTLFLAEDPRKIVEILEERKEKMNRIMPQLLSFSNMLDNKPAIRYFEGIEGIKNVYRDTLAYPDQEMLTFFSETFSTHFDKDFFNNFYIPKRVQKKIWVRAILPEQKIIRELAANDIKHLRQTKIVPDGTYNINIEINLYSKNKIGIISFEEKFALIIESEKIFFSLKNIFELMWKMLPNK
jgi:HTH-type transcriptional regulator, sugar sensing transcriptional regulator